MKTSEKIWVVIGLLALIFACYKLKIMIDEISFNTIKESFANISFIQWFFILLSSLCAYWALAWYDRIALDYVGHKDNISWLYTACCSFATYAIAHNLGASVFVGALIRFRAYSVKGVKKSSILAIIAICSFTFTLGTIIVAGFVMILYPELIHLFLTMVSKSLTFVNPDAVSFKIVKACGLLCLGFVATYIYGSYKNFPPLVIKDFHLTYPKLDIVKEQLIAGPLEICAASGIIYFALPENLNIDYLVVLGVFLLSFSLALISNAPGGVGVLELAFVGLLPEIPKADAIAALFAFRLCYLIIPFIISILIVTIFEFNSLKSQDK